MRLTKCKICRTPFKKLSIAHKVCSANCAITFNQQEKERKAAKETRKRKIDTRTRAEWLKLAQSVFNQYVRLSQEKDGCISCNRPATWQGQWHASHFRSVGAASAVRFNLWNVHKSCSICNNWKSGNLSEYEPRLRAKIGDAKVDWLREQNQTVKYEIPYLQKLIKVFKKKIKLIDKRKKLH